MDQHSPPSLLYYCAFLLQCKRCRSPTCGSPPSLGNVSRSLSLARSQSAALTGASAILMALLKSFGISKLSMVTRSLNARVMSNKVLRMTSPQCFPYCFWHPDVPRAETLR
ncbi:hypothetical protein BJX66DRAFT_320466 [Aspergillus keveii]|uniref:Uncharacterized protein n=1 Tax=Aspergillus keveii TaxID=714993 RepID=A0ABR4FH25_9EURO